MNKSSLTLFQIIILTFLLIYSCAKIGSPTGGPRDRIPPEVVETVPEAGSLNFSGDKIEITLNEYVALDNINDNLLVSPPMAIRPKVWLKGKTIVGEFEEDLRDSTTYSFNFQDAIKDLNEGNILEDYQFVFSTGPVLDSLTVNGNVYYAENLDVPEKVFVLMHRELADSAVRKHMPDYIAIIDRNGYFRIDNVRPGTYRLYALNDADNNKKYNLKDEEFAFMGSLLEVTADSNWLPVVKDTVKIKEVVKKNTKEDLKKKLQDTIVLTGKNKLLLFVETPTQRYLKSSERKLKHQLEIVLSLPPDTLDFDFRIPDADSSTYFIEKSRQKDTMIVWLTDTALYARNQISAILRFPSTDSSGMVVYKEDTVMLRYTAPKVQRGANVKKPVSLPLLNNLSSGLIIPGRNVVFRSETPLKDPDTSMIRLYDITKDTLIVPYTLVKDSLTATRYILMAKIIPEKKYFFLADSSAFRDYYGECSDSIGFMISVKSIDSFSKLTFNIKNGEGEMIVQLLDKSEKVIMEAKRDGDGKAEFPLLSPGIYRAKLIFDQDGDGKWTTGEFSAGRQPEPVTYYPEEIEVKEKFELEQDWDAGLRYEKSKKLRTQKKESR